MAKLDANANADDAEEGSSIKQSQSFGIRPLADGRNYNTYIQAMTYLQVLFETLE